MIENAVDLRHRADPAETNAVQRMGNMVTGDPGVPAKLMLTDVGQESRLVAVRAEEQSVGANAEDLLRRAEDVMLDAVQGMAIGLILVHSVPAL